LDGHIIKQLSIRELFGNLIISSMTQFSFSTDGRFLLFNSSVVPDDVGIASLYLWDIGAQRLSRLTSDPLAALDPKWLPAGDQIIFTGYVKGQTILVRHAENPSYSTR